MSQPPLDSYLLSHLRSDEHDLIKHLLAVLDTLAQSSLLSMAAHAAPVSNTSIALFETLAGAKNALARYADGLKTWEADLLALKSHEDGVARAARDRETLVTRVLERTQVELTAGHNRRDASWMDIAYADLQASEKALAAQKAGVSRLREAGLRRGLRERCQAMVDIGRAWMDTGNAGLLMLKELGSGEADDDALYTSNFTSLSISNASTLVNDDPADTARPRHVSFDTRTPPPPSPTPTPPPPSHRVRPLLRRLTHVFRRAPPPHGPPPARASSPAFPGVELAPADIGRMTSDSTRMTDTSERTNYTAESENTQQSNTSRVNVQIVPYTPPVLPNAS